MDSLTDEQRAEFSALLRDARRTLGLHQYQIAQATGIAASTLGLLERNGPYPSLRAIDLIRLISYYGLDIFRVAELLGIPIREVSAEEASVIPQQTLRAMSALSLEDRTYLVGVINVLLRGLRAG